MALEAQEVRSSSAHGDAAQGFVAEVLPLIAGPAGAKTPRQNSQVAGSDQQRSAHREGRSTGGVKQLRADLGAVKGTAETAAKPESTNNPDMHIDSAVRATVINNIVDNVKSRYFSTPVAQQLESMLRSNLANGRYDKIDSADLFSKTLTQDLQAVSHDKHLSVRYSSDALPSAPEGLARDHEAREAMKQNAIEHNFGITKAEILPGPGNIGYLKLDSLYPHEIAGDKVSAAMSSLAKADALIIDLTDNHGGDARTVLRVLDHLLPPNTTVNNIEWREGDKTRIESFITSAPDNYPKFGPQKPVYVLTSKTTFSGAEELSYDIQSRHRGKIIGDTTGGGANPGRAWVLNDHFSINVPMGQSRNPITHSNWERTGVHPDIYTKTNEAALEEARKLALKATVARVRSANP